MISASSIVSCVGGESWLTGSGSFAEVGRTAYTWDERSLA